jgi:hypothetical protein
MEQEKKQEKSQAELMVQKACALKEHFNCAVNLSTSVWANRFSPTELTFEVYLCLKDPERIYSYSWKDFMQMIETLLKRPKVEGQRLSQREIGFPEPQAPQTQPAPAEHKGSELTEQEKSELEEKELEEKELKEYKASNTHEEYDQENTDEWKSKERRNKE